MKIYLGGFLLLIVIGCTTAEKKPTMVVEGGLALPTLASTHVPLESIGNVHTLREDGRILRGATPEGRAQLLKDNGVTDVLIFRERKKDHAESEKKELRSLGYTNEQIHYIPMRWRKLAAFQKNCEQVITALKVISDVENNPNKKLYIHCTMGEDRTGMISGLYRILFQNWSAEKAYQQEMCKRGFADANPRKPIEVAEAINESLKDLYARMAVLIEQQSLTKTLDPKACEKPLSEDKIKEILARKCG